MAMTKIKVATALLVLVGAVSLGAGSLPYRSVAAEPSPAPAETPLPAAGNPSQAGAGSDRRQQKLPEAKQDKAVAHAPEPPPPEPPFMGQDHLIDLHEHLRQIHARFPHLAGLHEHFGPTPSGRSRGNHLLASGHPASGDDKSPPEGSVAVGKKVPDFTLTDLDGKQITLRALQKDSKRTKKGVVVLCFWCSFCGSCRRVEERLDQLAKEYQGDAAVVALDASAGETAERVREFARQKGLSLPILLDATGRTADLFGTKVTTTTVVLDGDGVLRYCGRFADGERGYAEEALKAVLAGKDLPVKTTPHDG
jgi:thiol-disulfide isomerase/thioredoxin